MCSQRQLGTETIVVAFNRENKQKQVSLPLGVIGGERGGNADAADRGGGFSYQGC